MDADLNPFRPGAGRFPPELTGREAELDAFDLLVARSKARFYDRGMMFHGLRGVGKTVLLRHLQEHATRKGWVTLGLEGSLGQPAQQQTRLKLGRDLAQKTRLLSRGGSSKEVFERTIAAISSLSISLGFVKADVLLNPDKRQPSFETGVLEIDFPEAILGLAEVLKEQSNASVVAFFIDEIQDLDPELLEVLLLTQHEAGQRELPFYVIGAGLPSVPTVLGGVKTYAERLFTYREIGALGPEAARRAFVEPVRRPGGEFAEAALERALEVAQGYPYFIQQFGWAIWNSAASERISLGDVEAGIAVGKSELDSGFYRTRWFRATEVEQGYLVALAQIVGEDGEARSGEVASVLGKPAVALSVTRKSLIEKGLIYSPAYGKVAFTVPGMQEFVMQQKN